MLNYHLNFMLDYSGEKKYQSETFKLDAAKHF